jgi:hypothetical protein
MDSEDVQSFYLAAKAAYLKAVNAQEYSHSGTRISFSKRNQKITDLRKEMVFWQDELARLEDDGGIIEGRITPEHDQ